MARHKYQGTFKDQNGQLVGSATTSNSTNGTISVFLAGTSTAADVYAASAGGTAVNSVSTDAYGYFYFWVDDSDYDSSQQFKITLSHADFESQTYDDIVIIPLTTDLASTSNGYGASMIGVEDAAANVAATNVEDAIAEIYTDFTLSATLASTSNGDGASLIGVEDSGANFSGTDVEACLAESMTSASTSTQGRVELATSAETLTGTSSSLVNTPLGLETTLLEIFSARSAVQRPRFVCTESLDYDGGTVAFAEGETVTGAGGATGVIEYISGDATSGTLYIHTRNTTAFVNDEVLTGSVSGAAVANGVSSKNSVVIYPAVYRHFGSTSGEKFVYWNEKIAHEFTSLGVTDWSYLYIDDSDLSTTGNQSITSAELVDSTTEPAWNTSKNGRYSGHDSCIFAVRTDGSSDMLEFFHNGGEYVGYANYVNDLAATDIDTTWTDQALTIPIFSIRAMATFRAAYDTSAASFFWRTKGQTGTIGHEVVRVASSATLNTNTMDVFTNSSQTIQIKADASNPSTIRMDTNGWYFPNDM